LSNDPFEIGLVEVVESGKLALLMIAIRSEKSYPRLVSPAKRTKPVTVWQLPDRYRRQRRENAGRRLISQPDLESKHPIIAAAWQFMRSIKGSLVGLVLAGILALAPTAAFAHGGGGGHFGGGGGHFAGGCAGHSFTQHQRA
jgi:hypothetical protein